MKYTYTVTQFLNDKYDISKLNREIASSNITIAIDYISGDETSVDIFFKAELSNEELIILNGIIISHDGIDDYVDYTPVSIVGTEINQPIKILDEYRDRSGKLRVHQTSRKLGLRIMWTGVGDDTTDPNKVGGGENLCFKHRVGDTEPMIKYIDFNVADNETWLHEGYVTWKGGDTDTLTLQMVPRVVTTSGSVGSNIIVYGGYLAVPVPNGYGNVIINNDLSQPTGGLVYMPNNDLGEPPTAYWDADWNNTTHKYENIRPSLTGAGRYNIFTHEITLAQFVREIPLLSDGFVCLASSDTDQLGQGMRLKMTADTNNNVEDHDWSVACIMCLHRNRST